MLRWLIPALLTLYAGCPYPVGSPAIPRSEAQIAARVPLVTSLPSAFPFGVASGDPLPDAVILWTMLDTAAWRSDSMVYWAVATDRSFQDTIISGQTIARRGRGCRVKVDATGLIPDRSYFYRFRRGEEYSEVGRTRTAPARGTKPTVNLAVVSCNALEWGYFNAYEALAERADLQAIVHLGDYIYEYASGVYGDTTLGRIHEPYHETVTAADYHARYAQYRRDPQLRAAHRVHPFICVWDDHEVANNSHRTGAENHTDTLEGDYLKRLTAAKQIYYDWMPIREQADGAIYRRFRFGDLAE
ncbi:MAG: alkaline phosphatase D family protein, partial [Bacteroidota bacterium]